MPLLIVAALRVPSNRESGYGNCRGEPRLKAGLMESAVRRSEGYQIFLQILIDQRISAGLTQADVAEKLRKPQSFVSKYERGERRLDFVEALQVSHVLGLDPRQLFARFQKKDSEK